jgi:hypothetical protein
MNTNKSQETSLPIRHSLTLAYTLSLVITLLMTAASVAGLMYRNAFYPTDDLIQTFLPNDVVNLFIGVPILLVSMWLTRRGQLIGLLFWPGALFYVLYNYIAYLFGLPFGVGFLVYLILVTLSGYGTIELVANIDGSAVQEKLKGSVPEKVSGGILVAFGILFSLRVILVVIGALLDDAPVARTELPVLVADFIVSPAYIIGGAMLWRREALGYVSGLGLLFQVSMLFIGLVIFMLIQPLMTGASFPLVDVVVVLVMGLVCFIPFGLFVRGVVSKHS